MPSTYAQSRGELIQAFIPKAKRFAELIRNRHIQSYTQGHTNIKRYSRDKMDFGYLRDDFPIHHAEFTSSEIPGGKEGIKVWFNEWCFVAFYDLRERVGARVKVERGPAQLLRKVPLGAQRIEGNNPTDEPQPLGKTFERITGKGGSRDIGARALLSIKNTTTVGGEASFAKNETEIQAEVESTVEDGTWYSDQLSDKTEWPGKVPPHSRIVVSRLVEVGRYRQQVTIDGELDYSVYVLSRGDFDVNFDGRDDIAAVLSGVGNTGKGGHFSDWARAYSRWPLSPAERDFWIEEIAGPVMARYVDYDEADQASDETWDWQAEPLEAVQE